MNDDDDDALNTEQSQDEMAQLLAYADGQLDSARQAKVEQWLATDPQAREVLQQLQASALPFRAAYDELTPPPSSLRIPRSRAARSMPRRWAAAAALALAIGLSFTAGRLATTPSGTPPAELQVPGWITQVMDYQALYARETVAVETPVPAARLALAAQLGRWLGRELTIPDLSEQQFAFKRGQPLTLGDRPLVQLVYLAPTGGPVALCVKTADEHAAKSDSRSVESGDTGGMRYAHWRDDGLDYVLVGRQALADLETAADMARTQL